VIYIDIVSPHGCYGMPWVMGSMEVSIGMDDGSRGSNLFNTWGHVEIFKKINMTNI